MKRRTAFALGAAAVLLSACVADVPFHQAPKAAGGQALVYVYRLDTWPVVRSDALFDVNGRRMAVLRANTYTWFHVPAGDHRLEQTWDQRHAPPATPHAFSAAEGSTNYLRLNVEGETMQMRWWLSTVPPATAAGEIAKCSFLPARQ